MNRLDSAAPAPTAPRSSLTSLASLAVRLAPRQLNDELSLAGIELKRKGAQVGVASALLGAALVLAAFMVVSLLVAAIMGLGVVMAPWLAALLLAALFLVLAAILGLIGALRVKKAMPLMPEEAWRGIRWDLGVLSEGRSFDPATLDNKPAKEEKPEPEAIAHIERLMKPIRYALLAAAIIIYPLAGYIVGAPFATQSR